MTSSEEILPIILKFLLSKNGKPIISKLKTDKKNDEWSRWLNRPLDLAKDIWNRWVATWCRSDPGGEERAEEKTIWEGAKKSKNTEAKFWRTWINKEIKISGTEKDRENWKYHEEIKIIE